MQLLRAMPPDSEGQGSRNTCHGWFQKWARDGIFERVLAALAEDLRERRERY